ncbi:MAG: hypothetical protein K1X92_05870 [Bacteroidia bacterium]|nr:hypothetical protein [Bacteroidia bacterium]
MKKEITILQLVFSIIVMIAMGWLLLTTPPCAEPIRKDGSITHKTEKISTEILALLEEK